LKLGERFSYQRMIRGQREIFGLKLFRIVLVDLPPQPRDSTVSVRVLVQEAPHRKIGAQTGYARDEGINLQGELAHRNFLGKARNATLSGIWTTGLGGQRQDDLIVGTRRRGALSMRQPHFLHDRLSGIVTAFADRQTNSAVRETEYGITTTLIYKLHSFRPLSLEYTYSEVNPFETPRFRKSVLALSALIGRTDDYINPAKGFLINPFMEWSDRSLGSDLRYFKLGGEVKVYIPLSRHNRQTGFAGRLYAGYIRPLGGQSTDNLIEDPRFDKIRFYAGGANDVRGWGVQALGPKVVEPDSVTDELLYTPEGRLSKIAGNLELRLPFPGLGSNWQTGTFIDFGVLGERSLRFGAGGGVRYQTPIGFLRFDVAIKLNPSRADQSTAAAYFANPQNPETSFGRRIKYYISIGHAF
jgi:outer membrane protein insertion porin family